MNLKLPISVKGIIIDNDKVILLRNERNEWELPGGRLEHGETTEECLAREIHEELGLSCSVGNLVDVWVYEVFKDKEVFIVTYICKCSNSSSILISNEHSEYRWFSLSEVMSINMPNGYKDSIKKAVESRNALS